MNWQPQLKYVYHGNMMRQVTIDQILFDIMKKTGKKETFIHEFSYKTHYELYSLKDSRFICSILMLPAINSPKISQFVQNLFRRISIYSFICIFAPQ